MGNKLKRISFIYMTCLLFITTLIGCQSYSRPKGKQEKVKDVECRFYYVTDSKLNNPDNYFGEPRMVILNYLIINHNSYDVFLPIFDRITSDSVFCSTVSLYIADSCIKAWFSTQGEDRGGILKANEKIHAELRIPERYLTMAGISADIDLFELLKSIRLRYNRCSSDTVYSKLALSDLIFTKNDTVAIQIRDRVNKMSAQELKLGTQ